jgi:hypothetical protein
MNRYPILTTILVIAALGLSACGRRNNLNQVQPIKFQYVYLQEAAAIRELAGMPSFASEGRPAGLHGIHTF